MIPFRRQDLQICSEGRGSGRSPIGPADNGPHNGPAVERQNRLGAQRVVMARCEEKGEGEGEEEREGRGGSVACL